MLLIRPKAIDAAALVSSNILETPPANWSSGTTYGVGDQASVSQAMVLSSNANMGVTSMGGGVYRLVKSGGVDATYDADAISAVGIDGDFLLRIRPLQTNKRFLVGVSANPTASSSYMTVDRGILFSEFEAISYYESSTQTGTGPFYTVGQYWFIRRVGAAISVYSGATAEFDAATLAHAFSDLSGTLKLDSSFYHSGAVADVVFSSADNASGTELAVYTSLQAANLGNDPLTFAAFWEPDQTVHGLWSATALYDVGDQVTNAAGHRLYGSLSGGTSAVVTMTIASPCVVTWNGHGLAAGTPILFQTNVALPTGLAANTVYYLLSPTANTFNVSATPGGSAINTTGSQSGTHTVIANPNFNKEITDPTFWQDVGPSNRFAMFDNLNGSVTSRVGLIDVTLSITGRADSLALVNLARAAEVRIIVTDALLGTVYDVTTPLVSTDGITNWYAWLYEPTEQRSSFWAVDLPSYSNPTIEVILSGTSSDPITCGSLVVGQAKSLGSTLHDGAQIGITDYSRKEADEFGNYLIVERPFSKRATFRMVLQKGEVDGVFNALAQYRATPAVFIATDDYESTLIFGFYRDFNIEIPYPNNSYCSLELEGLT